MAQIITWDLKANNQGVVASNDLIHHEFTFPGYCNEQRHNPNSASATLNKWLRAHAPEGCVVHSCRHSMRDRLRAVECPKEIIDQISGWSSSDVGESCGDGFFPTVVRRFTDEIFLIQLIADYHHTLNYSYHINVI